MPIMQNTTQTRTGAPRPPNWKAILAASKAGIWDGINCGWLNTARLDGGQLYAPIGRLSAPLLRSDCPKWRLAADVRLRIEPVAVAEAGAGIGADIAREIGREFADAWFDWADHFGFSFADMVYFPNFVAWPGPFAPPTPGLPSPALPADAPDRVFKCLIDGHSSGDARLSRETLGARIFAALETVGALSLPTAAAAPGASPGVQTVGAGMSIGVQTAAVVTQATVGSRSTAGATPYRKTFSRPRSTINAPVLADVGSPRALADDLAQWVQDSLTRWKSAMRTGVIFGQGQVPGYAPPYVPVGPVVGGTIYAEFATLSEFGVF